MLSSVICQLLQLLEEVILCHSSKIILGFIFRFLGLIQPLQHVAFSKWPMVCYYHLMQVELIFPNSEALAQFIFNNAIVEGDIKKKTLMASLTEKLIAIACNNYRAVLKKP